MNIAVIDDLERRYQLLVSDYQTGTIDETAFVASVDNLQFQDEWGRYWMMGAQTGAWHYYDGQTWHQADPRDADKLPFVDDQGRYWQRGASSGEWYYYDAATNEWVKPDQRDPSIPQTTERPGYAPYQSHLRPQTTDAGPSIPSQLDGELFQDDEGRYWMVGAKTGQWYFYEHDGWHPAHEFQNRPAPSQPYQPPYTQPTYPYQAYQQPAAPYAPPPQQPYAPPYQPPAPQPTYNNFPPQPIVQPAPPPAQAYASPPAPQPQPMQPQAAPMPTPPPSSTPSMPPVESVAPKTADIPNPPSPKTDSGSWYYFDGKQWLKYSSGEPATDAPPPDPAKIIEQKAEPAKPKPVEPVTVAELFEDDDDAIEVVDVEVITIIEAEPDEEPVSAPAPKPATTPVAPLTPEDEIRPRRASRPFEPVEPQTIPLEPRRQPRERTSTEPGRPIAPRKPETAHEPTIIIPTEAAASSLGGQVRPTRPISPVQPPLRRPRESTAPIDPSGPAHRDLTQPLQQTPTPRSDTAQVRVARAREDTKEVTPAPKPVTSPPKTGYSLGDIMRAFPSTFWSLAVGLLVLVIFGIIIIAGYWMLQSNNNLGLGSLGTAQSPTPTMAVAIANATPTPGPTPEATVAPLVTPAPPITTTFSSAALGFALAYPKTWQTKEDAQQAAFSPAAAGLDPNNLKDTTMWIGKSEEKGISIADILTKVLTRFPADTNTLNKGTINIASQTWTSAQISFADKNSGGQSIATLAVTSKDGAGYYLIAVAPAAQWNLMQPLFQEMINSFHFETAVAAAPTVAPSQATTISLTSTLTIPTPLTPTAVTTLTKPAANAIITYTVEAGDTLLGIAVKFGVSTDQLAAKNNITNPNSLRIGQELIIPVSGEQAAAAPVNKNNATTKPEAGQPITSTQATTSTTAAPPPPKTAETKPAEAAPLGGRIVYPAFNPGNSNYDIWLVDVASGKQSVIAGKASQPAFNRDGSLLAYRSWSMDSRGIFFRDFVGGRGGQVTRFVEDGMPTWSPDGFSFAFVTRREGDRVARIYRGDQLGQHDYSIGFLGEYPATFPDGRLVVKGCSPAGECGLYVIGANGGGDTKISGEGGDTAPAVSPDGSKIAFMSSARGATNWEIWVMNADGSNPQRLTENGSNDGLPAWSPDNKSIAFVSDQGGSWAIWVMNADGSNQRKLAAMNGSPDGKIIYAGDDSRGWLEERISWAP